MSAFCYSVIHIQRVMLVQIYLLSVWLDMRYFEDNNEYFSTVEIFYFRQYVICIQIYNALIDFVQLCTCISSSFCQYNYFIVVADKIN